MDKYSIGRPGEQEVISYLQNLSYKILEINYRVGHKEVDIIAEDVDNVIFIEVKTRSLDYIVEPYKAVNVQKQNNIRVVANYYLKAKPTKKDVRFDIISVVKRGDLYEITQIKGAFGLFL